MAKITPTHYIPLELIAQAKKNLKSEGYEIRGWARSRKFNPATVKAFFSGRLITTGRRYPAKALAIKKQLEREGLWPDKTNSRRAA